jgi:pilus assembly protein CpaF
MTADPATSDRPASPDEAEPPSRLAGLPLFATATAPVAPAGLHAVPAVRADAGASSLAQPAAAADGSLAQPAAAADGSLARGPGTLAQPRQAAASALAQDPGTLAHLPSSVFAGSRPPAGPAPTDLPPGPPVQQAPGRLASSRATVPAGPVGTVDWAQVRAFRQQAAELLTAQLRDRSGLDEPARREIGRSLIVAMLRDHADSLLAEGAAAPSPPQEQALAAAIFDALFGLGRLQPLVDDPDVENVEITGCDQVHLVYGDGRVRPGPAVADSDEELIETLAFLAARSGGSERAFTPANPILDLTLHGGARLAARAWITPRPTVVIRRHRLTEVDLADLQRLGMVDGVLAEFLAAAVRANKTIVVSGPQGAGKTTLVRALCNEMDPWERLGTIETEYELGLHQMPERHHRIVAHEARPGTGERTAGGRAAGEITLDDLLYACLRLNLSRVIVGEVRGKEVIPMFKAMQAGAGSLSTTHAHDARAAIERLVTCALEAGPHVTQEYAYLQIASHIDLIVQIGVTDHTSRGGRKHRYVSEVIEVARGEGGRPAVSDLFAPGPDGWAVPRTRPSFLADLQSVGFDAGWLDQRDGNWTPPSTRPSS